jgi:hypothetical protein
MSFILANIGWNALGVSTLDHHYFQITTEKCNPLLQLIDDGTAPHTAKVNLEFAIVWIGDD